MTLPGPEERRIWTVSQLVNAAQQTLWDRFPFVWVQGEVSGFTRSAAGHWYIDLKDENAVLKVPMFRNDNQSVPFEVETGLELIVGGEVEIYKGSSQFQVIARFLEPVGWGAMQLAFEQLQKRLAAEGLFDADRKQPLPLLPRCVGVVTSASGAAWRDMWRVWRKNQVPVDVVLAPAAVQGPGAGEEIGAAIELLNRQGRADVLIVGRGGGSREDLWAFNEEVVVRAISASAIPVVSAVGHEIDQTIADLVADRRAATPTAAAELVAASRESLLQRTNEAERRGRSALSQRLLATRNRLREPGLQRSLAQPTRLLGAYRQRLDAALERVLAPIEDRLAHHGRSVDAIGRFLAARGLATASVRRRARLEAAVKSAETGLRRAFDRRQSRLAEAHARIQAMSPLSVLGRGYAICERPDDGRIVRHAADVAIGGKVSVRLARDTLDCAVEATHEGGGDGRL